MGEGGDLRGLAAGCGAHVQDIRSLSRGECQRRQHGREALQVDASFSVDVHGPDVALAGRVHHKGVLIPGDVFVGDARLVERGGDIVRARLEGVGAQGGGPPGGLLVSVEYLVRDVLAVCGLDLLDKEGGDAVWCAHAYLRN